jgi:hypothetical protein
MLTEHVARMLDPQEILKGRHKHRWEINIITNLRVLYSQWKFIALQIQYTTVKHSRQLL